MTGSIGSLASAATAVAKLTDVARPEAARPANAPGEFSALLAALTQVRSPAGRGSGVGGDLEVVELEEAAEEAALEEAEELDEAGEAEAAEAAAAPLNVRNADRDLSKLDPEFRRRLERVVERMESEHGHSITIVEGHRPQARQNYLYEQGRTRPGNVVTWTRNSNHTQGRAVDVLIDGSYSNRVGYERLARIAAEEGLNTLGPKDPGHVELPRGASGAPRPQFAAAEAFPMMEASAPTVLPSGVARIARVAPVARVADVAQVAQVARVADPRSAAQPAALATDAAPQSPPPPAGVIASGGRSSSSGQGDQERQQSGSQRGSAELELLRADPGLGRAFASAPASVTPSIGGSDAVQRAAQILALKDSSAASPISHLTLRLDGAGGGEDRIRVDLRGNTIGTMLNIENAADAERLASRAGQLRQSLERQGLDADSVRIRTTAAIGAERVEPFRIAPGAEAEASRTGNQPRTGGDASPNGDEWQDAQDRQRREHDSRNRSRKEHPNKEGS